MPEGCGVAGKPSLVKSSRSEADLFVAALLGMKDQLSKAPNAPQKRKFVDEEEKAADAAGAQGAPAPSPAERAFRAAVWRGAPKGAGNEAAWRAPQRVLRIVTGEEDSS